jgi:hypothetical protein
VLCEALIEEQLDPVIAIERPAAAAVEALAPLDLLPELPAALALASASSAAA